MGEPMSDPKWMQLARGELGVKEKPGRGNNPRIVGYGEKAGIDWYRSDSTAWCAVFANAMLERAGYAGTRSAMARSFLTWGKKLKRPKPGCLVVFKRGNSSWQGHVAFFVRRVGGHIEVLGGNQRDAVNIKRYPASKLLGYRWPITATNSRTYQAGMAAGGGAGVGLVGLSASTAMEQANMLGQFSHLHEYIGYAAVGLIGVSIVVGLVGPQYARYTDNWQKGR